MSQPTREKAPSVAFVALTLPAFVALTLPAFVALTLTDACGIKTVLFKGLEVTDQPGYTALEASLS